MTSRNRKLTCNAGALYTVKRLCEFCRWQFLTCFWVGVHPSLLVRQDDILRYYFLATWKLCTTLLTPCPFPDLIRNMQWGACRCDGLLCKDCERMCPIGCSRCQRFSPGQVAKGFGGYCLSFPQHFLWLHKVTFGRLVAARGFQKKINVLIQQVVGFGETPSLILLLMKVDKK